MSGTIQLPIANFSHDLRVSSLAAASIAAVLALGALIAAGVLGFDSRSLLDSRARLLQQASETGQQLAMLRSRRMN